MIRGVNDHLKTSATYNYCLSLNMWTVECTEPSRTRDLIAPLCLLLGPQNFLIKAVCT